MRLRGCQRGELLPNAAEVSHMAAAEEDATAAEGMDTDLTLFGSIVPTILETINDSRAQFEDEPVLVGRHVMLATGMMEWERPVEAAIRQTLHSFVVSNHRDYQLLKEIFLVHEVVLGSVGLDLNLVVMPRYPRYETAGRTPQGLLTIKQAILVDNDQAFNCLVERCAIERSTLHNTSVEAEQTCFIGE